MTKRLSIQEALARIYERHTGRKVARDAAGDPVICLRVILDGWEDGNHVGFDNANAAATWRAKTIAQHKPKEGST